MGDRANVCMVGDDGAVWLYAHSDGSSLFAAVRGALDTPAARARWTDDQYLRRIVFGAVLADAYSPELGYGIGATIGDNEHAVLTVDAAWQRVAWRAPEQAVAPVLEGEGVSFAEFCGEAGAAFLEAEPAWDWRGPR